MTTETTNGQLTGHGETFRDKANRIRTVSSLDRLLRQVIATVPKDATKVREKIQKKYSDRRVTIEKQEKSPANKVIHSTLASPYSDTALKFPGSSSFMVTCGFQKTML